jgi:hypothetical protein
VLFGRSLLNNALDGRYRRRVTQRFETKDVFDRSKYAVLVDILRVLAGSDVSGEDRWYLIAGRAVVLIKRQHEHAVIDPIPRGEFAKVLRRPFVARSDRAVVNVVAHVRRDPYESRRRPHRLEGRHRKSLGTTSATPSAP